MNKLSSHILVGENQETNFIYLMNIYTGCSVKVSRRIFKDVETIENNDEIMDFLDSEGFCKNTANLIQEVYDEESKQLNITFLIHENCNFRCTYCYEKFEKNAMEREVIDGVINYIAKRIQDDSRLEHVHLAWFGGEPLLNLKGIEYISENVIRLCEINNLSYSSDITTNGFLLNRRIYEKLTKLQVTNYQITIDGNQEHHDSQRVLKNGKGTYQRIIDNLVDISKNTKDSNLIALRTNVAPDNFESMPKHIAKLISLFGEDERFDLNFHNVGNWGDKCIDIIKNNVALELSELTVSLGGKSEGILWNLMPNSYCYAGKKNNFVIGSDGMVYKCTVLLYDERNHIGNLENGELKIDDKKESLWVADKMTEQCFSCPIGTACLNKKCPALLLSKKVENCLYNHEELNRMLKLMDQQNLFTYTVA